MTNGAKLYSGNFTSKGLSLSVLTPRPNSSSYAAHRSPTVYKETGRLSDPFYLRRRMRRSRNRFGRLQSLDSFGFDGRNRSRGLELANQIEQYVTAVEQ